MGIGELLVNETHHVTHAVEQARHDDVARQALLRQLAQRGCHGVRIAAALGLEHLEQAEVARRPGADELLEPGPGTRHDDRPLVEGQDLAKGVVAAHRHHARGILHQGTEIVGEGKRADVAELRGAFLEGLARGGRHERAEHDHRAVGNVRIGFVGREHPVDQIDAVAAAARRHQDEGTVDFLRLVRHVGVQWQVSMEIAGIDHLVPYRRRRRDAVSGLLICGRP
jgi:hypothetical protein